jgi:putative transposase
VAKGFTESLNSKFSDEFLNTELLNTLADFHVLAYSWRWDYNNPRPHSALQELAPLEGA